MMLKAVRTECGQVSTNPRGVVDQSWVRTRARNAIMDVTFVRALHGVLQQHSKWYLCKRDWESRCGNVIYVPTAGIIGGPWH